MPRNTEVNGIAVQLLMSCWSCSMAGALLSCSSSDPPLEASVDGAVCTPAEQAVADGSVTRDASLSAEAGASEEAGVAVRAVASAMNGQQIFRFDTFGDEAFWTGALHLNQAIANTALGGVGAGVSPRAALGVGLKVDAEALPGALVTQIQAGQVNLDDPATTMALLKLDAVVGVKGVVAADNSLTSLGITCALCHSTVDDSFAPGIGKRLDGWPQRDLNVGAIISLAPDLTPFTTLLGVDATAVRTVLAAWGPGKFDAELALDGKGFRPDGKTAAVLIPPAYGLAGMNLNTFTGWGSVPYWNAFVANLEMHGVGNFYDPRLDDATQFPVAARARLGHIHSDTDRITDKLPALQLYQLNLAAPSPAVGSFDAAAAARGQVLFNGAAKCATCHTPPLYAEPGSNLHAAAEIGIDDFQANRSPTHQYRTTPLRGIASHAKGGFYHDGRFATLPDVIDHYDTVLTLGLGPQDKTDLVEFVKSL